MRVNAAQNDGMHHPDAVDISDEFSDSAKEPHIFFAFNS
jgi:hypothetical protein